MMIAPPVLLVSGVVSGQTVRLFTDSSCSTQVGTEVSTGTTVNITTSSSLDRGSYTFYANTTQGGQVSTCSTASISYVVRPTTPTGLSLSSPTTSPDNDQTPTIKINGVESGQSVKLFIEIHLVQHQVGTGTSTGTSINITSSSLNPGSYTFYANVTENSGGRDFYLFNCKC